ncbi:hypothetical protein BDZ90DRAFT_228866 [Jaminaea rosea]|uniref:Uncharacterized protein n=1 Tax=Jaminaea rosea TaxID=1569628 RepID=A0A316UHL2_9BASI|nr:hypothetical protein BDZ90DRAFT_228866 [Jaminaea rosea]PWN24404.1 hypothetical protein BDZ90DRAFT_228866 [Jaminaea rosea]
MPSYTRFEESELPAATLAEAVPPVPPKTFGTLAPAFRKFSIKRLVRRKPTSVRDTQGSEAPLNTSTNQPQPTDPSLHQRHRSQSQAPLNASPNPPLPDPPRRPSLPTLTAAPAVARKPVPLYDEALLRLPPRMSIEDAQGLGLVLGQPSSLVSSQGRRNPQGDTTTSTKARSSDPNTSISSSAAQSDIMRITTADSDGASTSDMWLQRPGAGARTQRVSVQRSPVFDPPPLPSLRRESAATEEVPVLPPLSESRATNRTTATARDSHLFSSDGGGSALEAEIGTARKVVGQSRAQSQSIMRVIEEKEPPATLAEPPQLTLRSATPLFAKIDTALQELRAVDQPRAGQVLGTSRSFVVPAKAGDEGMSTPDSEDDVHNRPRTRSSPAKKAATELPFATLPRRNNTRPSSASSAEEGKHPRESFDAPRPHPPSQKSSFLSTVRGGSHKRSKSSLAALSKTESSKSDKKEAKREREKEKDRIRRYADMKTNDPLLAERLALMGLQHGSERPIRAQAQEQEQGQPQAQANEHPPAVSKSAATPAVGAVAPSSSTSSAFVTASPSLPVSSTSNAGAGVGASPSLASVYTLARSRFGSRPTTADSSSLAPVNVNTNAEAAFVTPSSTHAESAQAMLQRSASATSNSRRGSGRPGSSGSSVRTRRISSFSPATVSAETAQVTSGPALDEAAREVLQRKTSTRARAPPLLVRKVSSGGSTPRQAPKHLSLVARVEDEEERAQRGEIEGKQS